MSFYLTLFACINRGESAKALGIFFCIYGFCHSNILSRTESGLVRKYAVVIRELQVYRFFNLCKFQAPLHFNSMLSVVKQSKSVRT